MRVCVYIGGFNLYYRRLKKSRHKWIDLGKLSQQLVASDDVIEKIRYFTADVSPRAGDPDAPMRQQTYFRALKARPLVDQETKYVRVWTTEEKGSDVNLASHLLMDGFREKYDVALVISQDSDLLEPMRMVKTELNKTVIIAWADDTRPGKRYHQAATFIRHIQPAMLARAAFPDPVLGRGGAKIWRPPSWDPMRQL
jgi:NYN domain